MSADHTANEKAPVVAAPGPFDHTTNTANYPGSARPGKALETLKAQFAAKGVHDGGNQNFIVVHRERGHSRHCPYYWALIQFGRQLGVMA